VRVGEESVPVPAYLEHLHKHYAELAAANSSRLTTDEVRSLQYFRADIVVRDHPHLFDQSHDRVTTWIRHAHALDDFLEESGQVPRRNTAADQAPMSSAGRSAALWLEDQRRPAARIRQCAYQVARIESYPGIDARGRTERWIDTFTEYAEFLAAGRRVPAARSDDPLERRLALWGTNQRRAFRNGTLLPERAELLRTLPIWTWGTTREKS
jgi:hypothetical protein